MFIDQVIVNVFGGVGGSGSEAMRREKGVPRGGPAGGDGGRGGSVVLVADDQLTTLADLRYNQHYRAPRGLHGGSNNKTGRSGVDLELRIPPGTIVRDPDSGLEFGEVLVAGDRIVVAHGGRGGRGNSSFTTAQRQTPRYWEPGEQGEERRIELVLKLIADVGLVGEPNAGKSTLLASITMARPKIADYPFTTLSPNLGVVELNDFRSFVMADIPGIIEGAHEGKGLGHQFLRHIERTRTLVIMVPLDADDPALEYAALRKELEAYSPALAQRPHCLVLSKADLLGPDTEVPTVEAPEAWGVFVASSVSRIGLESLLEELWRKTREVIEIERGPDEDADWTP